MVFLNNNRMYQIIIPNINTNNLPDKKTISEKTINFNEFGRTLKNGTLEKINCFSYKLSNMYINNYKWKAYKREGPMLPMGVQLKTVEHRYTLDNLVYFIIEYVNNKMATYYFETKEKPEIIKDNIDTLIEYITSK